MTTEQLEKANYLQKKIDAIRNVIYFTGDEREPKIRGNATDKNLANAALLVRDEFARLLYATLKELEAEFAKI